MTKPFEWKQNASLSWYAVDFDGRAVTVFRTPPYTSPLWGYLWTGADGRVHAGPNFYPTADQAKARVEYVCAPDEVA